jgi:hypothetical protein
VTLMLRISWLAAAIEFIADLFAKAEGQVWV